MSGRHAQQLLNAAEKGDLKRCQQLLDEGADVNAADEVNELWAINF